MSPGARRRAGEASWGMARRPRRGLVAAVLLVWASVGSSLVATVTAGPAGADEALALDRQVHALGDAAPCFRPSPDQRARPYPTSQCDRAEGKRHEALGWVQRAASCRRDEGHHDPRAERHHGDQHMQVVGQSDVLVAHEAHGARTVALPRNARADDRRRRRAHHRRNRPRHSCVIERARERPRRRAECEESRDHDRRRWSSGFGF